MSTAEAAAWLLGYAGIGTGVICAILCGVAPRGSGRERRTALGAALGLTAGSLGGLLLHDRVTAALAGASAAVWFAIWRRNRRRDRATRSIGEKSRALIADLVSRARDAARPSPVRRPALGGAR